MTVTGTIHTPIITIPGSMILGTLIPGTMIPGITIPGTMATITTDRITIPTIIIILITPVQSMCRVAAEWKTLRAIARSTAVVGIVT